MPISPGGNVGPYRIIEPLGQGGMATVFKVYHPALDRYVAIKVLHSAFKEDPNFNARFTREARIVAKLDHPNIVPIYDFAEHRGTPYLVMRFVEGKPLKAVLRDAQSVLPVPRVLAIIHPVTAALAYAHAQGVLHRDTNPSNIMRANDGHIYLTDFGLARIAQAGDSTMLQNMLIGTPPTRLSAAKRAGTDCATLAAAGQIVPQVGRQAHARAGQCRRARRAGAFVALGNVCRDRRDCVGVVGVLVDILNDYLAVAADALLQQEGTLDKSMGDAVMGIFNAPLPQSDHPLRAVRTALAMRAAVVRLHERLPQEMQLHYGIGIRTGEAIVGNVGTEQQMNYTAIGDTVNLAKRLQEWSSGGQVILSDQTCARLRQQIVVNPIMPFHVKGREAVVEVWELAGLKNV